ncbi:MAG: SWIM zinc finger family protein, partial [Longimicrobiales bacterium]|nr:SWIM zinc finger family protein [Longimicrobiales bacterium]
MTFHRHGSELRASCTCRAGQFGTYCKHRIAILSGDSSAIVSENVGDVDTVVEWLAGSSLAEAFQEL